VITALRAYPNNLRSATLDHSRYDWGMKIITCKTKRTRTRSPNNKTTTGYRISDDLWAVLQPLLPVHLNPHPLGGGRPRIPDRQCANAIFYVLRTGCQWQALDETELCAHSTAHDRYQEWVQAGVFLQLWKAGVSRFDERSCTWLLRVNISGSSVDHNRNKKVYPRELSWHPSGPLSPGATLDAGHSNARRLLRLPPVPLPTTLRAHTPTGCGHGGTRKSSISRKLQTWSVNPAAMAGVWGCQRFADPVPCVGSGSSKGIRKLACGRQKL